MRLYKVISLLVVVYLFEFKSADARRICCCDHEATGPDTLTGRYSCHNHEFNIFQMFFRLLNPFRCESIESWPYNHYVYNEFVMVDCVVDMAEIVHLKNVRLIQSQNSKLLNLESLSRLVMIKKLDLRGNKLTRIANLTEIFIQYFDLSHNQIEFINSSQLVFPGSVEILRLNDNRLRYVNPNAFANMYKLIELHLENNLLMNIDLVFHITESKIGLTDVILINNIHLTRFDSLAVDGELNHTCRFFVYNTSVARLPTPHSRINSTSSIVVEFHNRISFDRLNLTNVTFRSYYDDIRRNEVLANDRKIRIIDQRVFFAANESYSHWIDLSSNELDDLPILNLLDVVHLNLSNNSISKLLIATYLPPQLESLDLAYNKIEILSEKFFLHFNRLRTLSLAHNRIHSMWNFFLGSSMLTELDLSHNQLDKGLNLIFPDDKNQSVRNLTVNLDLNFFTRLPRFYGNVESIEEIKMSANRNRTMQNMEAYFFDNSQELRLNGRVYRPSRVVVDRMSLMMNGLRNMHKDAFCLNERNLGYNLVPDNLLIRYNYLECTFFCHLYYQLHVERPLHVLFHSQVRDGRCHRMTERFYNASMNRHLVSFTPDEMLLWAVFNESRCEPFGYYTCNYTNAYLDKLKVINLKQAKKPSLYPARLSPNSTDWPNIAELQSLMDTNETQLLTVPFYNETFESSQKLVGLPSLLSSSPTPTVTLRVSYAYVLLLFNFFLTLET